MLRDAVDLCDMLAWSEVFFDEMVDWDEDLRLDVSEAGYDLVTAFIQTMTAHRSYFGLVGAVRTLGVGFLVPLPAVCAD